VARAACCLNGALRPSEQAGGFPEPRPFRFPPGGVLVWNANAENCNHLMQVSPRSGGHLKSFRRPAHQMVIQTCSLKERDASLGGRVPGTLSRVPAEGPCTSADQPYDRCGSKLRSGGHRTSIGFRLAATVQCGIDATHCQKCRPEPIHLPIVPFCFDTRCPC
jgi:hypothetical protein